MTNPILSDIECKVLRIICNYEAGRHRLPTIYELCIKTGRDTAGILSVLTNLDQKNYVDWSAKEPQKIKVKERWEQQV